MKLFKKLFAFFALGFMAFGLGSCATTSYSATIKAGPCQIITDQQGQKWIQGSLEVYNNTIYNTKEMTYTVIGYDENGAKVEEIKDKTVDFAVRHGSAGTIVFQEKISNDIDHYEGKGTFTSYYNVWETYLGWWIAAIILVAISTTIYTVSITRSGLKKGELSQMMRDKVATLGFIFFLTLVICMFPIIFGSWVSTLILLGAFVATALLCLGVTGIRAATIKD